MSLARPAIARSDTTAFAPGTLVEVQIGARSNGRLSDRAGHWITCEVVAENEREVVVRLL